jgi:hypothetical protein
MRVLGFGGAVSGARSASGVEVVFSGLRTGAKGLGAIDLSQRSRLAGVEVSGFIGLDLLDGAVLEIDTRNRLVGARRD